MHIYPEMEAAMRSDDASQDVRAAQILPIHWGAFSLATHRAAPKFLARRRQEVRDAAITPQNLRSVR